MTMEKPYGKVRLAPPAESNAALARILVCVRPFLDAMHLPIAVINTEGRYVYYNEESGELDGCSRDFALGNLLLNVYPTMKPEESTMLTAMNTGRLYISHPQNYFNVRGKLLNYLHTTTPLYDVSGRTVGAIEVGWDISHTEKLQNQILSLTKRLTARGASGSPKGPRIITRSPKMREVIEAAKRFAATDVPVVLFGESGTGKELLAEMIYAESERREKPFVTLNCGALTDSLIDSSLFGTVKGAFTGAENSQGYLEIADGGTLFLDEFNSVSLPMQVKLLRFLQNKTFQRVGSPKLYRSDVRIIAAMNERPAKLIEEGRMRADVYYRLAVAELEIPPLRERMDDVPLLVDFFLEKYAEDIPYEVRGIKPAALDDLMSRSWPGNIRMLENAVLRSMVQQGHGGMLERIAEGFEVGDDDVAPPEAAFPDRTKVPDPANAAALEERRAEDDLGLGGRSLEEAMKDYERRIIAHALKETGGNIAAAAERLSMNRTTLNYKVKKLGIVRRVISPDN